MDGQAFLRIIYDAFVPFLKALGFSMQAPLISGRFYRVNFDAPNHMVSISYEPGDETSFVIIFSKEKGELSNIDDRAKTLRLNDLNKLYATTITSTERASNEKAFDTVVTQDKEDLHLLKCAKELCLVLPKYLSGAV